jgi:hypothetical protein
MFAGDSAPGEAGLLRVPFTPATVMTDQQRQGLLSGG